MPYSLHILTLLNPSERASIMYRLSVGMRPGTVSVSTSCTLRPLTRTFRYWTDNGSSNGSRTKRPRHPPNETRATVHRKFNDNKRHCSDSDRACNEVAMPNSSIISSNVGYVHDVDLRTSTSKSPNTPQINIERPQRRPVENVVRGPISTLAWTPSSALRQVDFHLEWQSKSVIPRP